MITWEEKTDKYGWTLLTAYSNKARIAGADWVPGRTCRLRAVWVSKKDYYGKTFTKEEFKLQIEKEWYAWIEKAGLREDY